MALHTRPRRSRKWAPDTLAVRAALGPDTCRVCGHPIVQGEAVHAFAWREEVGRAHTHCGFYAIDGDTFADREAVAVARKLLELEAGAPMPSGLRDEAIMLSLVRRVHSAGTREAQIRATTIGAALLRGLKSAASKKAIEQEATTESPSGDRLSTCSIAPFGAERETES